MKTEVTIFTCAKCGKEGRSDMGRLTSWRHLKIVFGADTSNSEWSFCGMKCFQEGCADIAKDEKKVPLPQVLTITKCDCCVKAVTKDNNSPGFGGNPFAGWLTVHRNRNSPTDHGRTEFHVCSLECSLKLKDVIEKM